jgi:hypothetical protein
MDAHYVNPDDWQAQQILHMLLTHRGKAGGLTSGTSLPTTGSTSSPCSSSPPMSSGRASVRTTPRSPRTVLEEAFDNTLHAESLIEAFEPDTSMRLPSLPYEDTFGSSCCPPGRA